MKKIIFLIIGSVLFYVLCTPAYSQEEKKLKRHTFIFNANLFDGMNSGTKKNVGVLVEDNLIKAIVQNPDFTKENAREKVVKFMTEEESGNLILIDGGGRTLMPGLIDCHVHMSLYRPILDMRTNMTGWEVAALSAARAENWLMTGFTTLRDIGGASAYIQRNIDLHKSIKGPRIFSSEALISQTTGHGDMRGRGEQHPYQMNGNMGSYHWWDRNISFLADDPESIRRGVRENFRRGATQIKILSTGGVSSELDPLHAIQYSPEETRAAVETAKDFKSYVATHALASEGGIRALENGVMSIEHGVGLDEPSLKLMKKKGAFLVTDLWVLMGFSEEDAKKQLSANSFKKWKITKGKMDETMKLAVKMDVNMAFGTDILPLPSQAQASDAMSLVEFEYLAKYMEPWKALRMATGKAGELVMMAGPNSPYLEGKLGMVKEGYYADMLLVNGDPTEDIRWITSRDNFSMIMKDGVIYKNTIGDRSDGKPSVVAIDRELMKKLACTEGF